LGETGGSFYLRNTWNNEYFGKTADPTDGTGSTNFVMQSGSQSYNNSVFVQVFAKADLLAGSAFFQSRFASVENASFMGSAKWIVLRFSQRSMAHEFWAD
jgi:hypothetical protein